MQDSLKKFDRIVAILIQLQSKKVVRAQELADRFEVSLRTIYRDMRTLEASGVPLYGEAGTGYSLVEGYRLPPVMFTREEASSFIAAEKLMQGFTDKESGEHYTSAMYKLKAVLRSTDKDLVSDIETKVLVRNGAALFHQQAPNALAQLFRSIGARRQAILQYEALSAQEPVERRIEPVGVYHENQYWYVFAYCHLRAAYRKFRTDRIHGIQLTDLPFSIEHEPLETYLGTDFAAADLTEIVIRVPASIAKHLKYDRHHYGFVSEQTTGEQIDMTFLSRDPLQGFARWFLMFADCAELLSPQNVKARVAALLQAGLERLDPFSGADQQD